MSVYSGPEVSTDGLLFSYDISNTQKSWIGRPTTNQFLAPTPYDSNGNVTFAIQGNGIFRRIYSGTYGDYSIQPTDVVYRYDLGTNGCHYHGNSAAIGAGQYVLMSCDYYISPDATGYPENTQLLVLENYGGSALSGSRQTDGVTKGRWMTASGTFGPTANTGTQAMFLYTGGCGTKMAASGYILMKNPMFEFRSDVNGFSTPVSGTRSNTQAIRDLTGTNTITATSLTYDSDGTFSFNGSSNYIDVTNNLGTLSQYTFCYWARRDADGRMPIGWRGGPTFYWYGDSSWYYTHGGAAGEYYYPRSVNIPTGTWGFYAVTYDGSAIRIYRNGVFEGSQNTTGTADWTNGVRIGFWAGGAGYYYQGKIDSVSMYNRALSAKEIGDLFNAKRSKYGL